jgi:LPXTG-motif cell wall-anchored protein
MKIIGLLLFSIGLFLITGESENLWLTLGMGLGGLILFGLGIKILNKKK